MPKFLGAILCGICCSAFAEEQVQLVDFQEIIKPFGQGLPVTTKCNQLVETANNLTGLTLMVGAIHCFREEKLVESALLISAADVRLAVEAKYFVPTAEYVSLFNQAWWIRTQFMRQYGRDAVFRSENNFVRLKTLFENWRPNLSVTTAPGWGYVANSQIDINTEFDQQKATRQRELLVYRRMIQDDGFYNAKQEYETFSSKHNYLFTAGSEAATKHDQLYSIFEANKERILRQIATESAPP